MPDEDMAALDVLDSTVVTGQTSVTKPLVDDPIATKVPSLPGIPRGCYGEERLRAQ
jgi:hypothetical protein